MEPFGWFIEVGELRWFTQDESRVRFFLGRKDVRIHVLVEAEKYPVQPEPEEVKKVECDHEPDVLKRCVKCGVDLSLTGMLTRGR